jgi:hypothetical protein
MQWLNSAATRRQSIAKGVSPWMIDTLLSEAPLGLYELFMTRNQGLTPLAIDFRPVGPAYERNVRKLG